MRCLLLCASLAGCSAEPARVERVALEDLGQAFGADEAAARQRFAGAAIETEGVIAAVSSPGSAAPTLWLRLPKGSAPAFMADGPLPEPLRSAGRRVKLRCGSAQNVGPTPYLYRCRLL